MEPTHHVMIKRCRALLLVLALLLFPFPARAGAVPPPRGAASPLGPELQEIQRIHREKGLSGVSEYARTRRIVLQDDRVEAVLEYVEGVPVDEAKPTALGAAIKARYRNLLLVTVPIQKLDTLARGLSGLERIRLPYRPYAMVQSQGVGIMGGLDMHSLGSTGLGVKVAIIDLGFGNLSAAQSAGELPATVTTVDYTGSGVGGDKHGTGVAEVVHDMAPDAELYLLKINSDVSLGNAKDYCYSNGIRVINHSVGWFNVAFYDGTGVICDIANDAYNKGILWVNASGNNANTHYEATMNPATSNDTKHVFSIGDEDLDFTANEGVKVEFLLSWDDFIFPRKYTDYDLFLYNNAGAQVKAAATTQGIFVAPTEYLAYTIPSGGSGTYRLVVAKRKKQEENLPFDLYFFNAGSPQYTVLSSSLAQPADAAGVLAVGAVRYNTDGLEGFSSRGPTNDGRTKPDVTAPDGVSNYSWGSAFYGTSASSPHVAGAAALVLSQEPTLTVDQLWTRLEAEVKDLGAGGKDDLYGSGRVSLDADQDGLTHDDEVSTYGTDPLIVDTDGDGLGDGDEVYTYGTDPLLWDTDGDYYGDGDEIANASDPLSAGSVPGYQKGDIAPHGAPDGVVDAADAMVALRIATGGLTATSLDLAQGDVYPLGSLPDGVIDISDALLILRKAAGLVSF